MSKRALSSRRTRTSKLKEIGETFDAEDVFREIDALRDAAMKRGKPSRPVKERRPSAKRPQKKTAVDPRPSPRSAAAGAPEDVVMAFIRAHFGWESAAFRRSSRSKGDETHLASINETKREYAKLISAYCAASVKPQPCAFGHPPQHDPKRETIDSVTVRGSRAVVRTKCRRPDSSFVVDYDYRLVNEKNGWRVKSLAYVDAAGRWECL